MWYFLASTYSVDYGSLLVFIAGIAILAGISSAALVKKLMVPGVVGYVVVGVILGPALGLIDEPMIEAMSAFNLLALGVIGFLLGGELKGETFTRYGRQVFSILLFSGLGAFFLVAFGAFIVAVNYYSWQVALSLSLVFGAICAATDPASTVNVIWENQTRGPVSSMLTTVVAMGDALAILLYIASVSVAGMLIGGDAETSLAYMLLMPLWEILGSVALGALAGVAMLHVLRRCRAKQIVLILVLGTILALVGLMELVHMDVILASMAMGMVLVNYSARQAAKCFEVVQSITPVIYILFFVTVGARLDLAGLGTLTLLLAGVYIAGTVIGKTAGANVGAARAKAVPTVRKYLGWCLYPQGTMAVALLIMASARFTGPMQSTMISVIILGIFLLQVAGPMFAAGALKRAGEAGLNIREEDLILQHCVGEVMTTDSPVISAGQPISEIIKVIGGTKGSYYCVVDTTGRLIGALTIEGIRQTFTTQEINDWLVALDAMEPIVEQVTPDTPLLDALELSKFMDIEHMPVVDSLDSSKFVGLLDIEAVYRSLSAEVLTRQQQADRMAGFGIDMTG